MKLTEDLIEEIVNVFNLYKEEDYSAEEALESAIDHLVLIYDINRDEAYELIMKIDQGDYDYS